MEFGKCKLLCMRHVMQKEGFVLWYGMDDWCVEGGLLGSLFCSSGILVE